MDCILCLDVKENEKNSIKIFSNEGETLNVGNIISQHFWIEPKKDESHQWICRQCWDTLLDFHEFYMRIKEAHKALEEMNRVVLKHNQSADVNNEIANELPTMINTRNAKSRRCLKSAESIKSKNTEVLITKRKRGRPKSLKKCAALEETPIDTDCILASEEDFNIEILDDIDIFANENTIECEEQKDVPVIKEVQNDKEREKETTLEIIPKKKRGRPPKKKKEMNEFPDIMKHERLQDSPHLLIKTELEFERIIDESFDIDLTAIADESQDYNVKLKRKKAEKKNVSLEFDEFIAKNIKLSCCLCQKGLENFAELKSHFRSEHKQRGFMLCCGKKLLKRGVLVDHLRTHQDPDYFKCTVCEKVMADRRCLELHMKTHQAKGHPAFKCEVCSKSFHTRIVYIRHVQNHMPEEMRKFECPECLKKFATKYFMNQHLKLVHLNTYSKICDVCGKKIHGRDALQRHQALHKSIPPPLIQCELCGLKLTTKYGLTRHMKTKHIADYQQPQVCPYCSKVSPSIFAQKRHIYYMHNIQRRHVCPMCEKAFKRTKDLREHMTTHTGDILYSCPYCPKTFNSDANMYAHRKKMHRKEWEEKMREKFPLVDVKEEMSQCESGDMVLSENSLRKL